MIRPSIIAVLFVVMSFISACKEKPVAPNEQPSSPKIELTLEPYFDATPIASTETIFTTEEGYQLKLREFKIIFTSIKNGNKIVSDAAMYSFENGKSFLKVDGTSEGLGNLNLSVGVDESLNHSDPSAFPNSHPLNILNASDMHWSWNPGYIFFKIEMIADTLADGITDFNHIVSYHVGKDEAFRNIALTNLNWVNSGTLTEQLRLKVDFKKILRNGSSIVDIKTESVTHSAPDEMPLTLKLATNFQSAISPL